MAEDTKRLNVNIEKEVYKRFKVLLAKMDITISGYVNSQIRKSLEDEESNS